jgi:hypothetical protein
MTTGARTRTERWRNVSAADRRLAEKVAPDHDQAAIDKLDF